MKAPAHADGGDDDPADMDLPRLKPDIGARRRRIKMSPESRVPDQLERRELVRVAARASAKRRIACWTRPRPKNAVSISRGLGTSLR